MANNVASLVAEEYSSMLQSVLRDAFIGKMIATTRFEGKFNGADTVHFPRLTPIVSEDLATSYTNVNVQDVVTTDETFVLDTRKAFGVSISDEDYIEMKIDPQNRIIQDWVYAFAKDYDVAIFNTAAAGAGILVDDGDLETASNGGAGNPIITSKTNMYDLVTAINEKLDTANVPDMDRFLVISPKEKRQFLKAPELLRDTTMGDNVVTGGKVGTIDNTTIYYSNNLPAGSLIAGQGKPVDFAANIKPMVQITPSSYRDNFANLIKAQTKFGCKVFTENAERLVNVSIA